ncbi:MAG: hypothetical protein JWR69_4526, partial [Pedosphaera sp.]|nr:hypothetical protein [Pedosphaera sp.]
ICRFHVIKSVPGPSAPHHLTHETLPILADYIRESELIAIFGGARLVKTLAGKFEIRGGAEADKQAAQEWMKIFLTPTPGNTPC